MSNRNRLTVMPGWLEKEPAAARLNVGMRQLENRAAKGEIRKQRLTRQPNERAARVLYSIEDIDAIKAGQPNHLGEPAPAAKPVKTVRIVEPDGTTKILPVNQGAEPYAPVLALYEAFARLAQAFPAPEAQKPWLTLAEAAAWSGLPAAWLVAQAKAGALQAVNVGTGRKEFWRFNRAALAK